MKRTYTLSMIVLALVLSFSAVNAQEFVSTDPLPRNVVLEEFTGIYCQFCPQGHAIADKLVDDNPGRVVLINLHSSDSYSKPQAGSGHPDFRNEWAKTIAAESGLSGYPSGQVNRQYFPNYADTPNKPAMSRSYWNAAAAEVLNDPNGSPVNIAVRNTFDPEENKVTIEVELYYTEDAGENNLLNVVFLENGVIGAQYNTTGLIPDYEHNKILRDMITGQWGEEITETTEGSYVKKTYEYPVPDEYVAVNCDIAAFVTTADHKYIYTGVKESIVPSYEVYASIEDQYYTTGNGTTTEATFTLTNPNDIAIDVEASIEDITLPTGWSITLSKETVNIPAGGSADIMANITGGAQTAYIGFTLNAIPINLGNDVRAVGSEASANVLHEDAKYIYFYGTHNYAQTNATYLASNASYASQSAFIPLSEETLNAYPAENFDFLWFSVDYWNRGALSVSSVGSSPMPLTDKTLTYIEDAIANGANILINATNELGFAINGVQGGTISSKAQNFFSNTMGLQNVVSFLMVTTNSSGQITGLIPTAISGVTGDPISNGLSYTVNNSTSSQPYQVMADYFDLTASSNSEIFLTTNVNGSSVGVGARTQVNDSKIVFTTIGMHAFAGDPTGGQELLQAIVDWFEGASAGEAIMNTNANGPKVEFGDTEVNESSEFVFEISNVGDADLKITGINITNDNGGVFSLESESTATIAPDGKEEFTLKFSPTESGSYTANLEVLSNNAGGNKATFNISGTAIVSSVQDGVAGNESVFTMEVSPNPIVEAGKVKYQVNGAANRNVTIKVMNSNGDVITTLVKGNVSSGTHTIDLNAFDFTSGNYFLIGTADGYSTQLPIVIVK